MKAYRPSRFASSDEYDEDNAKIKAANVESYAKMAENGRVLFEEQHGQCAAAEVSVQE